MCKEVLLKNPARLEMAFVADVHSQRKQIVRELRICQHKHCIGKTAFSPCFRLYFYKVAGPFGKYQKSYVNEKFP
jgi:hypothetical protein